METSYSIRTDFNCVFLLNGAFSENADRFTYDAQDPLYVTVLPLSAHLLPYTVKLLGARPLCNENLCSAFRVNGQILIKLFERYNYIYTAEKIERAAFSSAEKLFKAVKQKNFGAARAHLTDSLSRSVNDEALIAFFSDYAQILKDDFSVPKINGAYYLVTNDGIGVLHNFESEDGLIDNITSD
jgi:hypothetical protein